jgi:hypothetical protein
MEGVAVKDLTVVLNHALEFWPRFVRFNPR